MNVHVTLRELFSRWNRYTLDSIHHGDWENLLCNQLSRKFCRWRRCCYGDWARNAIGDDSIWWKRSSAAGNEEKRGAQYQKRQQTEQVFKMSISSAEAHRLVRRFWGEEKHIIRWIVAIFYKERGAASVASRGEIVYQLRIGRGALSLDVCINRRATLATTSNHHQRPFERETTDDWEHRARALLFFECIFPSAGSPAPSIGYTRLLYLRVSAAAAVEKIRSKSDYLERRGEQGTEKLEGGPNRQRSWFGTDSENGKPLE